MCASNGSRRAERRRRTRWIALRRQRLAGVMFFSDPADLRTDAPPPGTYRNHLLRHSCSKRTHGRPELGHGACRPGLVRDAVIERIRSGRLCRDLIAGRIDPDEVLPHRGRSGLLERRRPRRT